MGATEECKRHLRKFKAPKLLELSLALRSISHLTEIDVAPVLASYADDYPHGKYYVCCFEDAGEVDLSEQEAPLEELHGSQAPFTHLPFPDNFFDVIVSGSVLLPSTNNQKYAITTHTNRLASHVSRSPTNLETRVPLLPPQLISVAG